MNYEHLITVEPGKRSGKPCIRGMRITVYDVLEYLASGMTEDEILADFSELTREDIKACLSYDFYSQAAKWRVAPATTVAVGEAQRNPRKETQTASAA